MTIFSICVQAAIGITVFVAIGRLFHKGVFKRAIVTAAALSVVGIFVSLLHLGKPMLAYKALMQFGSSWLSREIWLMAFFAGFTVVAAILVLLNSQKKALTTSMVTLAAFIGLINVYAMASIYSTTSVLVWQGMATFIEFFAVTLSIGAVLFLTISVKEAAAMRQQVALAVAAVIIIQVTTVITRLIFLGGSSSIAIQNSMEVLGNMAFVTAFQWIAILAGVCLVLWVAKEQITRLAINVVLGSALLLLVGQIIGRYGFYASIVVGLN